MVSPKLENRYRLLLAAYPARYRLEILTTLMDSAPSGKTRPSPGDAISLLLGGFRLRLSLRGTSALAATALALVFAAALGTGGAALAWRTAGDLPSDRDAYDIAVTAVPANVPPKPSERKDYVFAYDPVPNGVDAVLVPLLGGDDYLPGFVQFTALRVDNPEFQLATARESLHGAGWEVGRVEEHPWGRRVEAYRRDVFVTIELTDRREATIWIQRATPPLVPWFVVLGLVTGALLGWWTAIWLGRRNAHLARWRQTTVMLAFWLGVAWLAIPTMWTLAVLATSSWNAEPAPLWVAYMFIFSRAFALLGALLLLISLALAATARTAKAQSLA